MGRRCETNAALIAKSKTGAENGWKLSSVLVELRECSCTRRGFCQGWVCVGLTNQRSPQWCTSECNLAVPGFGRETTGYYSRFWPLPHYSCFCFSCAVSSMYARLPSSCLSEEQLKKKKRKHILVSSVLGEKPDRVHNMCRVSVACGRPFMLWNSHLAGGANACPGLTREENL